MFTLPMEMRFEESRFNYLYVMVLCVLLQFSMMMSGFSFKERKYKILSFVCAFAFSVPASLILIFAHSDYKDIRDKGIDYSLEKINEVNVSGNFYRLYRTNGGATTSYGLVLRKEVPLVLGLKIVEPIFSKYKAYESSLSVIGNGKIKLTIEPYGKGDKPEMVTLNI